VKKIHYHSDLSYFGGSENMIANFLNSQSLNQAYQISLSYRLTEEYETGLHSRLRNSAALYPIRLPIFSIYKNRTTHDRSLLTKLIDYAIYLSEYLPIVMVNLYLLQRLFRQIKPEILHINNGGYPGALSCRIAVLAAKLAGIKNIVFVVNNMAANYRHPYRWPDIFIDRLVARNASLFVTGSSIAMARLRTVLPVPESQTVSLPNGIDARETSETPTQTRARLGLAEFRGTVFGMVGVMEPRKGHLHLLKSLKILTDSERMSEDSLVVLIEGSGGVRQNLEKFSQDNGLEDIVKFIGVEDQIFNFFNAIDVLVYPAIQHEDFPNVISEAMSLSKPVIATRVAGADQQIINGHTGILVEVLSEVQLADAMVTLSKDHGKIKDMGKLGRERFADLYTVEKSVKNYERLYEKLLKLPSA
jgi:glycosyltransferase involved in cell wall biosynthesis